MTSIKSSFNYDDCEYEPTIDSKFIDCLFQLIVNGNEIKVKEFLAPIIADKENDVTLNGISYYEEQNSTGDMDLPFTIYDDNMNDDEIFDADYEDSDDSLKNNKLIDLTFSNAFTPLMLASQKGMPKLVEYFIAVGFDVNKSIKKSGLTALLAACSSVSQDEEKQNHFDNITASIKLLVEAGANVTDKLVSSQQTALHLIASGNNIASCKYLINFIDINCKNSKNCTPLMIAATKGHSEIVKLLLEAGSDVEMRNFLGLSAVELAMINNHHDIVQILLQPTDNLDFYKAWSLVHKDHVEAEKQHNINESFTKKFYSSKYFSDPIASMCAALNLTHLQPVLEKHGVTFPQLRSMSETDMKKIGIVKFSDRKILLNLMHEVHKMSWAHQTSIYTPNYKTSITSCDILDVVRNAFQHIEFIDSTIGYIAHHLQTNPSYYANSSHSQIFFDKCVGHCQFSAYKARSIHENIVHIDSIFDKMYDNALEEDVSSQLDDKSERRRQENLSKRMSSVMKTGIVVSCLSVIGMVAIRLKFVNT